MQASSTDRRQQVISLLEEHGVLPTRQRVDIAGMLLSRDQHLSAEQILSQVNADGDSSAISKATVYNTLGLLARKRLIRELVIDPGRVVYDSNLSPHYHLFNVDTGELLDVSTDAVRIGDLPELPAGTTTVGIDVVIRIRNQPTRG
jgi:Fur family iron response transcriptional regulator